MGKVESFQGGMIGGSIGVAAGRLGESWRLRSTEEFKEVLKQKREALHAHDEINNWSDGAFWSYGGQSRSYQRSRTEELIDESGGRELARLEKEYLEAQAEFEKHHKHLKETTTRAEEKEDAHGIIYSRSENHAHDQKYFDLERHVKETRDAYYERYDEGAASVSAQVGQEMNAKFPNRESIEESYQIDWDHIREVHGDLSQEFMIVGAVAGIILGVVAVHESR